MPVSLPWTLPATLSLHLKVSCREWNHLHPSGSKTHNPTSLPSSGETTALCNPKSSQEPVGTGHLLSHWLYSSPSYTLSASWRLRQTPWVWAALQSTCWNPSRMEDYCRNKVNFLIFSKRNPRKKSPLEGCSVCLRTVKALSEEGREGRTEQVHAREGEKSPFSTIHSL